ncbi:hypothetical protein [Hymenobacter sp. HSC-4F20]|uniref:hypothetical protein n=1 Tax=Hymenobacter sp. HSC-4F20 TaxID=2864135 RepID=UPI001C7328AD|nr:hypothetical protein [Hymenobacter sp. HSC-4F20]
MIRLVRLCALSLLALSSLNACHSAADEVQPNILEGTWQLTASGGGITGVVSKMPANIDYRLVFGPNNTYYRYENGTLRETSQYQLPTTADVSEQQQLLLKTTNTPTGEAIFCSYNVTTLSATELEFMTPGGCPMIYEYTRLKSSETVQK